MVQDTQDFGQSSPSARSFFPIAPPVDRLNVFQMVVSPRPSHTSWVDVVGHDVGVFGKFHLADRALAVLGHNLSVQ